MTNFQDALERTLQFEGRYSNDPADPGKETYRGISRRAWPDWKGWQIIDATKGPLDQNTFLQDLVARFYQEQFWNPLRCAAFPQFIANELFDTGVNVGVKTAAKFLQRSLNLLNNNGKTYSDIVVDGVIGGNTLAAFDKVPTPQLQVLLKIMNVMQGAYYVDLMEHDSARERWIGWFSRVDI